MQEIDSPCCSSFFLLSFQLTVSCFHSLWYRKRFKCTYWWDPMESNGKNCSICFVRGKKRKPKFPPFQKSFIFSSTSYVCKDSFEKPKSLWSPSRKKNSGSTLLGLEAWLKKGRYFEAELRAFIFPVNRMCIYKHIPLLHSVLLLLI